MNDEPVGKNSRQTRSLLDSLTRTKPPKKKNASTTLSFCRFRRLSFVPRVYAGEYHCAIKPCVCISRARERMKKRESRSIGEQTFSFLTARLLFFEMHFASFFSSDCPLTKDNSKGSVSTVTTTTTPFILSRKVLSLSLSLSLRRVLLYNKEECRL